MAALQLLPQEEWNSSCEHAEDNFRAIEAEANHEAA